MPTPIDGLLARVESPGTFATRRRAPAECLEIEIAGVGPLTLPVSTRLAERLRSVARPSPFGLGEKTLHDTTVRSGWEVARSRVKIAAKRWKPMLTASLRELQRDLGVADGCRLEAVFDKLVMYEPGQFFKPHQDSEKSDDMVGTLVVILPSEYTGGGVTVEHRGEKKSFRRVSSQAKELSLLAFYADCRHEVSPLRSGVRVALTYQLKLVADPEGPIAEIEAPVVADLVTAVRGFFAEPIPRRFSHQPSLPPERFVYLLDHEYTQRSLSWLHLKNGDRARVAALRAAAARLDCDCFLALAEVHETWSCDDDPYDPYRRRTRRAPVDDAKEPELVELFDTSVELSNWLDGDGQPMDGTPAAVLDHELHFTKRSHELAPFRSEHEGYQGNYGNTVDRWYHRAAFVMWPRANTFSLRAQVSPQWAVDEILALPQEQQVDVEARVRSLLPHWDRNTRGAEDARFVEGVLRVSVRIDDRKLALAWLLPLRLSRFTQAKLRRGLVASVATHGLAWAKELFTEWTKHHHQQTPDWAPLLVDLCAALHESRHRDCEALASWWVEQEATSALARCIDTGGKREPWLAFDSFEYEARHLAHVLAAAASISSPRTVDEALAALHTKDLPLSFCVSLLRACLVRSPALAPLVAGTAFHRTCIEQLGSFLRAPARAEGDFRIRYKTGCRCADCKILDEFTNAMDAEHDWPLNKDRRQHIHRMIDSAQLPMRHTTLRVGSPYVLQLRKSATLFTREREFRARIQETHDALVAVLPASASQAPSQHRRKRRT